MIIQVNWASQEHSIVIYKFPNEWDWNDFEAALETGFGLIESVSRKVNTIFDLTQTHSMPQGALLYWSKMVKVLPENHGKIAFATSYHMSKTMVKLFGNIHKRFASNIIMTEDVSQALQQFLGEDTANKTILVIDDEDHLREELVDLLMLEGYQVLEASSGLSGLQLAQIHKPSLIISDVSMPHMDGFSMLDALRKNQQTEQLPVIFVTARTERSFIRHGMELGADDYITKPFSSHEVISAIQSRLHRINSLQSKS